MGEHLQFKSPAGSLTPLASAMGSRHSADEPLHHSLSCQFDVSGHGGSLALGALAESASAAGGSEHGGGGGEAARPPRPRPSRGVAPWLSPAGEAPQASATNQVLSMVHKARDLLQKQQQIEAEAQSRCGGRAGGGCAEGGLLCVRAAGSLALWGATTCCAAQHCFCAAALAASPMGPAGSEMRFPRWLLAQVGCEPGGRRRHGVGRAAPSTSGGEAGELRTVCSPAAPAMLKQPACRQQRRGSGSTQAFVALTPRPAAELRCALLCCAVPATDRHVGAVPLCAAARGGRRGAPALPGARPAQGHARTAGGGRAERGAHMRVCFRVCVWRCVCVCHCLLTRGRACVEERWWLGGCVLCCACCV